MRERDLDLEFSPNSEREYQYDFDLRARKMLLRRWSELIVREGKSLEMGSFDGSMTELLMDHVSFLDVVEGSAELSAQVRGRIGSRIRVIHSWFEDYVPSHKYDQIFLVHSLEHVEDPVLVLKRAASWLATGGKLLVAVPNANALSRQIAVKMGLVKSLHAVTEGERKHGHRRTYSLDTLLADFREAGVKVIESGGVILKPMSNSQFDSAFEANIVNEDYLLACDDLARLWPDFSASIFVVATTGT
jgi:2-polyprenyl-3-methyl-5-hydroxy-6-metoxy-1,4-benzoquinol methylase